MSVDRILLLTGQWNLARHDFCFNSTIFYNSMFYNPLWCRCSRPSPTRCWPAARWRSPGVNRPSRDSRSGAKYFNIEMFHFNITYRTYSLHYKYFRLESSLASRCLWFPTWRIPVSSWCRQNWPRLWHQNIRWIFLTNWIGKIKERSKILTLASNNNLRCIFLLKHSVINSLNFPFH